MILGYMHQPLSPLQHHWLTEWDISLMVDKIRLHIFSLFSNSMDWQQRLPVKWNNVLLLQKRTIICYDLWQMLCHWVYWNETNCVRCSILIKQPNLLLVDYNLIYWPLIKYGWTYLCCMVFIFFTCMSHIQLYIYLFFIIYLILSRCPANNAFIMNKNTSGPYNIWSI